MSAPAVAYYRAELPVLIEVANTVAPQVRAEFGSLRADQLNWKPTPDKWSVGQCKAPKILAPTTSAVDAGIITRFIDQQERVVSYLNTITAVDTIIITSPVARVITYSLLDACRVIVAHEQRHILQARRVMQLPEFPK